MSVNLPKELQKTTEEIKSMNPEEITKWQEDMNEYLQERQSLLEAEEIRREAAEKLLEEPDTRRRPVNNETDNRKVEEDNRKVADADVAKEVRSILAKYDEEDLSNPQVIRKLLDEFGRGVVAIAFQRATGQALGVMDKVLTAHANMQATTNKWRNDHPDMVEHEEIVEFFLIKRTDPRKPLQARIDEATELARKHLGVVEDEGRRKEREANRNVRVVKTLTPNRSRETRQPPKEPETRTFSDAENQKELHKYLDERRRLKQSRMTGVIKR